MNLLGALGGLVYAVAANICMRKATEVPGAFQNVIELIMEMLEGWEAPHREYFQWDKENIFSIYYQGKVYSGQGILLPLPEDAPWLGGVRSISATPDEELESSLSMAGRRPVIFGSPGSL